MNAVQATKGDGTTADIFVVKLDPAGSELPLLDVLGAGGTETENGIAVNAAGYAYIVGTSSATGYPLRTEYSSLQGRQRHRRHEKLAPNGGPTPVYSTYVGGTGADVGQAIALDATGNAVVVGQANGATFPTSAGTFQASRGNADSVVVRLESRAPLLSPSAATAKPKATQTFTATEGSGLGYTFSLKTNLSGGSITTAGVYTAGAKGSVTDVVQVKDSEEAVGTVDVTVGPGITIVPATPEVAPFGTLNFTASGGSGAGFTWTLSGTPKGSITAAGKYTAPGTAGVTDTAVVQDSLQNTASVQISVGGAIAIAPATPKSPPRGSLTFTATKGSGTGYVWSLTQAPSGGTITAAGAYKAGTKPSVTDVAKVKDSLGNESTINIEVGPGVSIDPPAPTVLAGGAITFKATGGSSSYKWTLQAAPSKGSLDEASGIYSAGLVTVPVTDIVLATDSLGNTQTALVQVKVAGSGDPGSSPTPPAADEGGCAASPARNVWPDGLCVRVGPRPRAPHETPSRVGRSRRLAVALVSGLPCRP